jgi:hypothetical protein
VTDTQRLAWIVVFTISCFGCEVESTEIDRRASPSGTLEAVAIERDAGATASTALQLYLVAKGQKALKDPFLSVDQFSGFSMEWLDARTLLVRLKEARVFVKRESLPVGTDAKSAINIQYQIDREVDPVTSGLGILALSCIEGWPDAQTHLSDLGGKAASLRLFRSRIGPVDGWASPGDSLVELVVYSPDESRGVMFLLRRTADGRLSIIPKQYRIERAPLGWSADAGAPRGIASIATQLFASPYEVAPILPATRCTVER